MLKLGVGLLHLSRESALAVYPCDIIFVGAMDCSRIYAIFVVGKIVIILLILIELVLLSFSNTSIFLIFEFGRSTVNNLFAIFCVKK